MNYPPGNMIGTKILTLSEVEQRVVFSGMHIYRLEQEGLFPERMLLADRRVGWREQDVTDWMQSTVDSRFGSEPAKIESTDRFITLKEVCRLTSLSRQTMERLEERGAFPRRISIGIRRIAWLEREVEQWLLQRNS